MCARNCQGYECTKQSAAQPFFRNFVAGKGAIRVDGAKVRVSFPRRAHNPILRDVPWRSLPSRIPGQPAAKIELRFT